MYICVASCMVAALVMLLVWLLGSAGDDTYIYIYRERERQIYRERDR